MPDEVTLTPVPGPNPVISNRDFDRLVRRACWMVGWRLALMVYVIATLLGHGTTKNPAFEFIGLLVAIGFVLLAKLISDLINRIATGKWPD